MIGWGELFTKLDKELESRGIDVGEGKEEMIVDEAKYVLLE